MPLHDKFYAVLLHGQRIGTLVQRGDYVRFLLNQEYLEDANRPVLGLRFEERLRKPYASALRLPPWFSNLLPEGPLREWIASERGVSLDREMELLAQVGHDLPGAVQVLEAPDSDVDVEDDWSGEAGRVAPRIAIPTSIWRFSLAGVALKFSMIARADRLTVPAVYERGDWLVKFPDYRFANVPTNEYVMMAMANAAGIDVPEIRLVNRDELEGLPDRMWPNDEEWAFAIRRFDRCEGESGLVHIEDFAQVRDVYPERKYQGSMETVAALCYRSGDTSALQEFARRLAFLVLIGNGDAHMKNWSLIYRDRRIPTLSPAYDLVATQVYRRSGDGPEDLGLKFGGTTKFDSITLSSFARLEARLSSRLGEVDASLELIAEQVVEKVINVWPGYADSLSSVGLAKGVDQWIQTRAAMLLRKN